MNRLYIASLIAALTIVPATAHAVDINSAAKVQTSNTLLNGTSHIAINGVLDDRSFQRRSSNRGQRARGNRGQQARGSRNFRRNTVRNRSNRGQVRNNRIRQNSTRQRVRQESREVRQSRRNVNNSRRTVRQARRNNGNVQAARQNVRQNQSNLRSQRRDLRGARSDNRQFRRDDRVIRNDRRQARRDNRRFRNDRAFRNDRRQFRGDNRRLRSDRRFKGRNQYFYNGRFHNRWKNDWRRFSRFDFKSYRKRNRSIFRLGFYSSPFRSHRYSRFGIGGYLGSAFFHSNYWISNPSYYRLPPAYGAYRWVRYFNDILLVDIRNGYIADAEYGFFT